MKLKELKDSLIENQINKKITIQTEPYRCPKLREGCTEDIYRAPAIQCQLLAKDKKLQQIIGTSFPNPS